MIFDQLFLGITLATLGKVLLGITVMMVHSKMIKENGIDGKVLTEMKRERNVAILGIVLILAGYILEITAIYEIHLLGIF